MSTETDAELTYGALDFLGDTYGALDGMSTGSPESLLTAIPRLLLDGEIITHDRDGNRDLTFQVEITGDDILALNEAEAELVREVNKPRNELRWKPPGLNTPVTVFDTWPGVVVQVFDDFREMVEGKRVYSVTIPALPHARSETLTTTSHTATTRQELVSITTGGSVRAPGTLEVYNASTALGRLLVFTCEDKGDGYRPDVARYYVSGGSPASEADNLSGYSYGNGAKFDFPNSELTAGPYRVFVRHTISVGTQFSLTVQTYVGSTAKGDATTLTVRSNGTYDADSYIVQPLGFVHLPTVASATEATSAVTRITLNLPDVQQVDEVWLFRDEDAQLTWVEDAAKYVWLLSPSVDLPYGAVFMGDEPGVDGAPGPDAVHPGSSLKLFGRHIFEAPSASVFKAASTALPHSRHSNYHTWHSNSADDGG